MASARATSAATVVNSGARPDLAYDFAAGAPAGARGTGGVYTTAPMGEIPAIQTEPSFGRPLSVVPVNVGK